MSGRVSFRADLRPAVRVQRGGLVLGLSWLGWSHWSPCGERGNGFWYVQLGGWHLWADDATPQTVGERGVW